MEEKVTEILIPEKTQRFFEARTRLKPITAENLELVSADSSLWNQPPHIHEQAVVTAYVALREKQDRGDVPSVEDAKDVVAILEYVHDLTPAQAVEDVNTRRLIQPVLLLEEKKTIIANLLNLLKDEERIQKFPNAPLGFLQNLIARLANSGLIKYQTGVLDQIVATNYYSSVSKGKTIKH